MIPLIPIITRAGAMLLMKQMAKRAARKKILKDAALKKKVDKIGKKALKKEAKEKPKKRIKRKKVLSKDLKKKLTKKASRAGYSPHPYKKPADLLKMRERTRKTGKWMESEGLGTESELIGKEDPLRKALVEYRDLKKWKPIHKSLKKSVGEGRIQGEPGTTDLISKWSDRIGIGHAEDLKSAKRIAKIKLKRIKAKRLKEKKKKVDKIGKKAAKKEAKKETKEKPKKRILSVGKLKGKLSTKKVAERQKLRDDVKKYRN
jgi:hypothetical protein